MQANLRGHTDQESRHKDRPRRGILATVLVAGLALSVTLSVALAESPQAEGKRGGKGKVERKGKGDRAGKGKGKRAGSDRGRTPDASEMATRLMRQFDKDRDRALNAEELTAALRFMRERRGTGSDDSSRPARGKGDRAGKGKGKRAGREKGNNSDEPGGGVTPKKPGE